MDWLKRWLTWPKIAAILSILFGGNAALGLVQGSAINSGAVAPSAGIAIAAAVAGGLGAYNRRVIKVESVGEDIPPELAAVMNAAFVLVRSPLVTADQQKQIAGILAECLDKWAAINRESERPADRINAGLEALQAALRGQQ